MISSVVNWKLSGIKAVDIKHIESTGYAAIVIEKGIPSFFNGDFHITHNERKLEIQCGRPVPIGIHILHPKNPYIYNIYRYEYDNYMREKITNSYKNNCDFETELDKVLDTETRYTEVELTPDMYEYKGLLRFYWLKTQRKDMDATMCNEEDELPTEYEYILDTISMLAPLSKLRIRYPKFFTLIT